MKSWRWWLAVVATALLSVPTPVWAMSDVDILLNKLVQKGLLTGGDVVEIRQEMAKDREANNRQLAKDILPEPVRNWTWGGDIRLREEARNRTGTGQDVNRQRVRFRYGFDAKVADGLKVGARLATGSTTDPISTNQTFNTAFNHKTIVLDRAFAEYSPEIPGLGKTTITGGIIPNPFWTVGQLVWDEDLNFDGAAVKLSTDVGPRVTLFTNDGAFALTSDIGEASSLWSVQGGLTVKPFPDSEEETLKNLKLTSAIAYHDYKNVTNPLSEQTTQATAGGAKGNSTALRDFNLVNPTFEIASQYKDVPFGFFSDWVHNTAASDGKTGYMFGVRAGKAQIPFDLRKGWEAGYFFERIGQDATFGPFADSDFGNGGTNHLGHAYWIKLAALKNSSAQLKYLNTWEAKGPTKNHADTFQADWITKF